jgi:hypothetical protein
VCSRKGFIILKIAGLRSLNRRRGLASGRGEDIQIKFPPTARGVGGVRPFPAFFNRSCNYVTVLTVTCLWYQLHAWGHTKVPPPLFFSTWHFVCNIFVVSGKTEQECATCVVRDYDHDGLASYCYDRRQAAMPERTVKSSWMHHKAYAWLWGGKQFGNEPVGTIHGASKHLSSHYSLLPASGSNSQSPSAARALSRTL